MHNYTNLKIFLWSGSGDGSNEPTEISTTAKIPFYSVNKSIYVPTSDLEADPDSSFLGL